MCLPKAAWYSLCVIRSRCGASKRSDGRRLIWVIGWVGGRGVVGLDFEKGVCLGEHDRILLFK